MLRPIPGVLYAGRFYADERPGGRPGVFPSACSAKEEAIQDNWCQTEQDRQLIRKSKRVARDRPYSTCQSCMHNFSQPHVHSSIPNRADPGAVCCLHCHKVRHLCTCYCHCAYCINAVCSCPLCICSCGTCLKCRQREAAEQKKVLENEMISRRLVEKFEDEQREHERRQDFKDNLHKMQQEELRLEQALIDCETFEERGKLKHKMYLNQKLMTDCKQLLNGELIDSHSSENEVLRISVNSSGEQPTNEKMDPVGEISPSSSESLPEPHPRLRPAEISEELQLRLLERLFGKSAKRYFESGQDCVKILHPSFFTEEAGFTYQGEVVEPEICVNSRIYGFSDFSDLYKKVITLFARASLSQFERNVAYALVVYSGIKNPVEYLFKARQLGSHLTYVLPFPQVHQPPFALVLLDGKPVANVGVPIYCGRAMLPRELSVEKHGRFEVEVEFKSDLLLKTAGKAAEIVGHILGKYMK